MTQAKSLVESNETAFGERQADTAFDVAEALQRAMRIDPVTQLPNRRRFVEDFGFGVSTSPHGEGETLVMLSLAEPDQYTHILRALGHSFAEEFVRLGADRLRKLLPDSVPIYHISVLNFAFPLSAPDGENHSDLMHEIVRVFSVPLSCAGVPICNRIGLGVTPLSGSMIEPSEMLRGALAAVQDSRTAGEGWAWYNPTSDQAHLRSFRLLADLGRLTDPASPINTDQLYLEFQPRISLDKGACVSVEALLRWMHPALGLIAPNDFVPLAETTALITPLTRWVVRESIAQYAEWYRDGMGVAISINVSPENLCEPDFADYLLATCADHRVDPSQIEIEFTENTLTMNNALTQAQLRRLRHEHVSIALDDFGSGYSNMRYLHSIPADTLKIDKDFIMTLDTCENNQKIVPTIIDLGHRLGYRVVAEGIETLGTYETLASWGCDEGQGFFMSRPLSEAAFREWYWARSMAA